jgi:hypothetical protein
VYGDARAFFGEAQGDAAADALGTAGDEDGLARKGGVAHDCPQKSNEPQMNTDKHR